MSRRSGRRRVRASWRYPRRKTRSSFPRRLSRRRHPRWASASRAADFAGGVGDDPISRWGYDGMDCRNRACVGSVGMIFSSNRCGSESPPGRSTSARVLRAKAASFSQVPSGRWTPVRPTSRLRQRGRISELPSARTEEPCLRRALGGGHSATGATAQTRSRDHAALAKYKRPSEQAALYENDVGHVRPDPTEGARLERTEPRRRPEGQHAGRRSRSSQRGSLFV